MRIEKQQKQLGPQKLEELKNQLAEATKKNDTPFPDEILSTVLLITSIDLSTAKFSIPDASKISFFPVKSVRNDEAVTQNSQDIKSHLDKVPQQVPFFIEFDRILPL